MADFNKEANNSQAQKSASEMEHEERMEVIKGAVTLLSSMIKLAEKNAIFRHEEAMARIDVEAYNALTRRMQVTGKEPEPIDFKKSKIDYSKSIDFSNDYTEE